MSVLIEKGQQALQQALKMNAAAHENDWEAVAAIQSMHTELISEIAIAEAKAEQAQELRTILLKVRELNHETENLAGSTKEALIKEKKTLDKAGQMQKALDAFK